MEAKWSQSPVRPWVRPTYEACPSAGSTALAGELFRSPSACPESPTDGRDERNSGRISVIDVAVRYMVNRRKEGSEFRDKIFHVIVILGNSRIRKAHHRAVRIIAGTHFVGN